MKTYNGHRSWNAWNVALWINNNEPLYRFAKECIKESRRIATKLTTSHRTTPFLAARAAKLFMNSFPGSKTPDGAKYNNLSVKLCLQDLISE